jgi:hypothetical protein
MDAEFGDVDKDGDLDVIIAVEGGPNLLYLNDGNGVLTEKAGAFIDENNDNEDLGIADFDADGNLDVIFIAEDGANSELYLGDGEGNFQDVTDRLPQKETSNAVEVADINNDSLPDIIVGVTFGGDPDGMDFIFINDPDNPGNFIDESEARLPAAGDATQDIKLGDLDGDGDLDMVIGNEEPPNRLLINVGDGVFQDSSLNMELVTELMTREVLLFDADGDEDLDMVFCNLTSNAGDWEKDPRVRILMNDGNAHFTDETDQRLPENTFSAWDGGYLDYDADGDIDLVICAIEVPGFNGDDFRAWTNNGQGVFTDQTAEVFPADVSGHGWDVEVADLDSNGTLDLYLCNRPDQDLLLLGTVQQPVNIFQSNIPAGFHPGSDPLLRLNMSQGMRIEVVDPGNFEYRFFMINGKRVRVIIN